MSATRRDAAIQAIPTTYKGYRFRSRLEARWAAVFLHLGVPFDYELQSYQTAHGYYLPDFWLRSLRAHAEVKPVPQSRAVLTKYADLAHGTGFPVILLVGTPSLTPCLTILPSGMARTIDLGPSLATSALTASQPSRAYLHAVHAAAALRFS